MLYRLIQWADKSVFATFSYYTRLKSAAAYKITYIRAAETPRMSNLKFYNIARIQAQKHVRIIFEIISRSFSEAKKDLDVK